MVNEEIDKLLSDEGITPKFTIEQRKKVLELAIKKEDLTNANRAIDSFEDKLDMKPTEIKFQQTTQIASSPTWRADPWEDGWGCC